MGLLSQPKKGRGRATPLKELGKHPDTEEAMEVFNGRYGPYVKMGKINASLPDDIEVDAMTAEKAIELLADKLTKTTKKKTKKKATKKAKVAKKAAKKKLTKKKATKKAATKKATKKKTVIRRSSSANS